MYGKSTSVIYAILIYIYTHSNMAIPCNSTAIVTIPNRGLIKWGLPLVMGCPMASRLSQQRAVSRWWPQEGAKLDSLKCGKLKNPL